MYSVHCTLYSVRVHTVHWNVQFTAPSQTGLPLDRTDFEINIERAGELAELFHDKSTATVNPDVSDNCPGRAEIGLTSHLHHIYLATEYFYQLFQIFWWEKRFSANHVLSLNYNILLHNFVLWFKLWLVKQVYIPECMPRSSLPAILCCVLPSEIMLCLCIFCLSPPGSGPIDGNTMEWICLRESLRLAALPRGTGGRRGILARREPNTRLGWHTKEWVISSLFCPDLGRRSFKHFKCQVIYIGSYIFLVREGFN